MKRTHVIILGFWALLIACVLITGCTDNSAAASPTPQPSPAATPFTTQTTKAATTAATTVPTTVITQSTTTITASPTATITPNTTVPSDAKPSIRMISPDEGNAASNVSVTNLAGGSFISGATVRLKRTGSSDIIATGVVVQTPASITCTLPIPANAKSGTWDLVVTNPNGQSATYSNLFSVHGSTIPLTTATTQGSTGTVGITLIDPSFAIGGDYNKPLTLTGSNFKNGVTVKLINTLTPAIVINSVLCEVYTPTTIRCSFNIPSGSSIGTYDVVVTNTDATTGTMSRGFAIR